MYFKAYFNQPTAAELGTMVAILEVGAFISSLCVGRIGDVLGRRKTILYGSLIFIVGGALQTCANGMPMMMLGRIIAGLGVGALSTIVPVYQSEISPPHNRGRMGCIEFTGNIAGYATSVWVDYFCSYIQNDWAWRVPLFMQCVMGLLLACGSLLICESPRYVFQVVPLARTRLTGTDGSWTTTTTRRVLWSSPTCMERATFTTPRRETSTARSR
jgi:MFS family permease